MSNNLHTFAGDNDVLLSENDERNAWIVFGVLLATLTWGYGNMLIFTSSFWSDDLYSHGWIIPLISAYLFWRQKRRLTQVAAGERWIGLAILVVSMLVRIWASSIDMNPVDRLTFISSILGIVLIVGGFPMLRWAGLPLVFLVFMFPLPTILESSVLWWLQKMAAIWSTFTLQLLGIPALREGNKIAIDGLEFDVADACSGLRMGTIFGAMSVALAMVINRPWWDRMAILVSAIPVALLTNVIRITITALLSIAFPENKVIKYLVHDGAGFAMMPIAMGFLWLELQILHKITVPIDDEEYATFGAVPG